MKFPSIYLGEGSTVFNKKVTSLLILMSLYITFDERDKNDHEKWTSQVPFH